LPDGAAIALVAPLSGAARQPPAAPATSPAVPSPAGPATVTSSRAPRTHRDPFDGLKELLSRKRLREPLDPSEDHMLSILMFRRGREEVFGKCLFSDPAWDILLELYAAHLGRRTLSTVDLAAEIGLPESTVTRWVDVLAENGIVDRPGTVREAVSLTDHGAAGMQRLAGHWGSAFLSI